MLRQHSVFGFLFVIILSALIQADDEIDDLYKARMECLTKNNLTLEDLMKMTEPKAEELPENVLCAMKCETEVIKVIDENGNVNPDNIENCPVLSQLPTEQKTQLKECLGQIGKIETCQDMVKALPCSDGLDFGLGD